MAALILLFFKKFEPRVMIDKKIIKRILSSKISKKLGISLINYDLLKYMKHYLWIFHIGKIPYKKITFNKIKEVREEDIALCERLITAYHRATVDKLKVDSDTSRIWSEGIGAYYGKLISILQSRNAKKLAEALSGLFRERFVYGLASGDLVEHSFSKIGSRIWSLKYQDNIVALAEYLGVVRTESTQQGLKGYGLKDGLDTLVSKIEDRLGISIDFPDIGAPYGVNANNSLITMEHPEHIYVALRTSEAIRVYLDGREAKQLKLLEIGAGFGGLAYWIFKQQRLAVATYTIIDLPLINVLQGYFLSKALGASGVALYGEAFRSDAKVFILPTFAIAEDLMRANGFDVLINQNSMPEMSTQIVENYLRFAKKKLSGIFFSYNHEAYSLVYGKLQVSVPEAVARVGGFRRLSRNISWVRSGYVEEVYKTASEEPLNS